MRTFARLAFAFSTSALSQAMNSDTNDRLVVGFHTDDQRVSVLPCGTIPALFQTSARSHQSGSRQACSGQNAHDDHHHGVQRALAISVPVYQC